MDFRILAMNGHKIKVSCPNCKTEYRIDSSKIPANGANAKCKKCNNKFFIKLSDIETSQISDATNSVENTKSNISNEEDKSNSNIDSNKDHSISYCKSCGKILPNLLKIHKCPYCKALIEADSSNKDITENADETTNNNIYICSHCGYQFETIKNYRICPYCHLSIKCINCGKEMPSIKGMTKCQYCNEKISISEDNTSIENKKYSQIPCSDENCVGIIGSDGLCGNCGKPYKNFINNEFCKYCGKSLPKGIELSKCPYCENVINIFIPKPKKTFAYNNNDIDKTHENNTVFTLGIIGSTAMILGVFLPIMKVPIFGSINYIRNGESEGTFILILGIISLILILMKKYEALLYTGFFSFIIMGYTSFHYNEMIRQLKTDMDKDLTGNPFKGLAEATTKVAIESIQLEWGIPILIIGTSLVIVSAVLSLKSQK